MADGPSMETRSGSSASAADGSSTKEKCEDMIRRSLRTPMVKFLKDHLEKAGCTFGDNFIKAVHCDEPVGAAYYVPGEGMINSSKAGYRAEHIELQALMNFSSQQRSNFELINRPRIGVCGNLIRIQDEVNQAVIHELIHAYDECRAKNLDWTNCAHRACSEIRAGHLSGDCHYKRELLRGHLKIRGHGQDCVRRRVMKSLSNDPYCSETAAKDAMEAVWDVCYNDTEPFDRAP